MKAGVFNAAGAHATAAHKGVRPPAGHHGVAVGAQAGAGAPVAARGVSSTRE